MTTLYDAIKSAGFDAPESILWDGVLHRFPTDREHHRHSDDGWYVAYDDAKGKAAAFGSWRDGSSHTWSNGTGRILSAEEQSDIDRKQAAAKEDAKKKRDQTAQRAQRLYDQASTTVEHSAYLERKGIRLPHGVRAVMGLSSRAFGFDGNEWPISGLLVPMRNREGAIRSLQIIPDAESGKKLFMKSGQTDAMFHVLGELDGAARVLIAEGLATAQSAREATGETAVVAFSAGNLPAVALAVRTLNATAEILICADDDPAGRKGAEACAGCRAVYPGGGYNDFNDLHQAKGLAAVKAVLSTPAEDDVTWRADLIVKHKDDGTQTIPCRVHNLIVILGCAQEFKGRIRYNDFSSQVAIDGKDIDDVSPVVIKAKIEKDWIADKIPTGDVLEAMSVVAAREPFHPVKEYLAETQWDGHDRILSFFTTYCGCQANNYLRATAHSLFVSAVARILKPGCKVDTMVILQSAQGMHKSMLWLALFNPWCVEITASLSDKDFYAGLRGVWCADFSELDAFSRSETTQIKRILTAQTDSYRPHYGRTAKSYPRQCVFVGGTNKDDWNTDSTGGRRFLPVNIERAIDIDAVKRDRDQLWAEALVRFMRGESWWNIPNSQEHQEAIYQGDPWDEPVQIYLAGLVKDWEETAWKRKPGDRLHATIYGVLLDCLRIEKGKQTRADQMRVAAVLKRNGWERKRLSDGKWVYVPKKE